MKNFQARLARLEQAGINSRRVPLLVFPYRGETDLQRQVRAKATAEGVPPLNVSVLLWGNPT